jgi:hypothetical protein
MVKRKWYLIYRTNLQEFEKPVITLYQSKFFKADYVVVKLQYLRKNPPGNNALNLPNGKFIVW